MFHNPEYDSGKAVGHIEHTEVTFAGQAYRIGRYPIHFHINGDMSGSYVRGSSIHHTFNRAINIHNSHNILIENNVVHDVMGGAFFLEDSIEHSNIFQYNFLAFVKSSTSLRNDDVTAAAFWITFPDNIVQHNHVAGCTHFGFWYRMHEHPDGPSYDETIWPRNVPLGVFYNNTVHSCGRYGLWIFEVYDPKLGATPDSPVPVPAVFRKLTAWHNLRGAEWVECSAIQFWEFCLVENDMAGVEAFHIHTFPGLAKYSKETGTLVKDTVIAASFDRPRAPCTYLGMVGPLDAGFQAENIIFINFNKQMCGDRVSAAIGTVKIICTCRYLCGGYKYKFRQIHWKNCDQKFLFEWEHQAELMDEDGTLTGVGAGSRVYHASDLLPPECQERADFTASPENPGVVCPPPPPGGGPGGVLRLTIKNLLPENLMFKNLIVSNRCGIMVKAFL